jgi:hypothetical protein
MSSSEVIAQVQRSCVFNAINFDHLQRARGIVDRLRLAGLLLEVVFDDERINLMISHAREGLSVSLRRRVVLHKRALVRLLMDPAIARELVPAPDPPPPPRVLRLPINLGATGVLGLVARAGWRPDRGPRETKRAIKDAELLRWKLARRR